jgi:multiple sugar transport system permease protein
MSKIDMQRATTLEARAPRAAHVGWWARNQRHVAPYIFISPFYILFVLFLAGPAVFAFLLSFTAWNGVDVIRAVGLANYASLLTDGSFGLSIANTLWYMFSSLFLVCPLALVLALVLNSGLVRGKWLFRTMYFIPAVTSVVAIAIMFLLLYDKDYGLINAGLQAVGLPTVDWLGDPTMAKIAVIGLIIWRWTGFIMIYFLAGLQAIPREMHEAAWVDGANRWQSFLHVTIPLLRPVILFVAVIVLIGSAQVFEEPYILTRGGPADATLSIVEYLYRQGFEYLQLGYASAIGVALFVAIFALSLLQMRFLGAFRED